MTAPRDFAPDAQPIVTRVKFTAVELSDDGNAYPPLPLTQCESIYPLPSTF